MKRHPVLGILSVALSVPMLAVAVFLFAMPVVDAILLLALARLLVAGSLLTCGILLLRGHKAMYSAGLVAWGLAVTYSAFMLAIVPGPSQDLVYILVGVPVLAFLFRASKPSHAA